MKKRILAYWLCLLSLVLVFTMLGSAGKTYARYQNTVSYNTVAAPQGDPVSSDCLHSIADAPVTVVLGEHSAYQLSFTMTSRKDISGTLSIAVSNPDFVTAKLQIGNSVISTSKFIGLTKDLPVTVNMMVQATQSALSQEREALPVYVQVTWDDSLTGTFQLILPPVQPAQETVQEEPEDRQEEALPLAETKEETTDPTEETDP